MWSKGNCTTTKFFHEDAAVLKKDHLSFLTCDSIRCTLNELLFGLKTNPAQSGWGNVFEQTR